MLHSIGFAPQAALVGNFMKATWEDVATAMQVSAYSLKSLAVAALPLMRARRQHRRADLRREVRVAGLRLDGRRQGGVRVDEPLPAPDDLGPQGIRVNLVAAGPIRTTAAKSIPGFEQFEKVWGERAPARLGPHRPGARGQACVALLSDWFPATTGEIVHVDGGVHAMGQ